VFKGLHGRAAQTADGAGLKFCGSQRTGPNVHTGPGSMLRLAQNGICANLHYYSPIITGYLGNGKPRQAEFDGQWAWRVHGSNMLLYGHYTSQQPALAGTSS